MAHLPEISPAPPRGQKPELEVGPGSPEREREADLVIRARGDREAFAELYRLHQPAIACYVRRRLGPGPESEDAIAETFVAALENLARFEPRGIPFRAWLYRLALSRISRHARALRKSRAVRLGEEHPEQASAAPVEDAELARAALLSLSRGHQEVLSLHHIEGLSVAAVAGILGLPEGTVKARLSRGRERLRLILAPKLRSDER